MNKKRLVLVIVILILLSAILNAQTESDSQNTPPIPEKVLKALPGQGLSSDIKLPDAIRMAVEEQSNYYLALKIQEEEERRRELLNLAAKIIEIAAVILIVSMTAALLLDKKLYKKVKRKARRQFLYHRIRGYLRDGKDFKEIKSVMLGKGMRLVHVQDVIVRYRLKHRKKKFSKIDDLLDNKLFKKTKRRARRQFLYHRIRGYLRDGKTFKEIKSIMLGKGMKPVHVQDAIVRYQYKHNNEVLKK